MNTDNQTQYQVGDTQLQNENTVPAAPQDGGRWKLITMGGAAGILVGAGALYAGTAVAGNTADDALDVDIEKADDEVVTLEAENGAAEAVGAQAQTASAVQGAQVATGAAQVAVDDPAQPDNVISATATPAAGTTVNVNVSVGKAEEAQVAQPAEGGDKAVLYSQVGHVEIYSEAPIAHGVDDSMSFSEAFAAARAEVGPGGVFHYRGGDYGTYYADEWQAMSQEEHEMYADSVHPEVPVDKVDVPLENPNDITINIQIDGNAVHTTIGDKPVEPEVELINASQEINTGGDTPAEGMEVTFEGYEQVAGPGGEEVGVLGLTIEGQEVAMLDVDGDNQFDYAIADVNGDGEIQQGEVLDLNTGEAVDFDSLGVTDGMEDPTLTADAGDIDLGADFINDADVQLG